MATPNNTNVPRGAPTTPPGQEPPDTEEDITVEDDADEEDPDDAGEDDAEEPDDDEDEPKEDLATKTAKLEGELKKKNADSLRNRRKRREAEEKNRTLEAELKKLREGDAPDTQAQLAAETERAENNHTLYVRSEFAVALKDAGFTGSRRAAKRLLTPDVLERLEFDDDGEIDNLDDIIDELKEDFSGSFSEEAEEAEPERTPANARLTAADKGGRRAAKKAATTSKTAKFTDPTLQQAAFLFNPRQVQAVSNSRKPAE